MNAAAALLVTVLLLGALAATAGQLRHRPVLSVLLWAQCFYWLIAYVGRGLLLLSVQPMPRLNDALADPRLNAPSYPASVARVLWTVNLGLAVYVLAVRALARRRRGHELVEKVHLSRVRDCAPFLAWSTYALGWAFRVAAAGDLVTVQPLSSVVTSLALFGSLGAALLLLRAALAETRGRFALLAGALLVSEFAYSALTESKTPLISVLLFTVLGYTLRGWRMSRWIILIGVAGFVLLFPALQYIKESTAVNAGSLAAVDQHYPIAWRPLLPLFRRFDLLSAATDAANYPAGQWLGWGGYSLRILHGLAPFATPRSWVPYGTAGLSWTAEIRRASLPNAGLDVSLADGFIAEGYVFMGLLGVALLAFAFALVTNLVARMTVSPNTLWFSMALLLLSQPILFERGALGLAETVGQSAQAALAFVLLWWLLRGRVAPGAGTLPSLPLKNARYGSAGHLPPTDGHEISSGTRFS